MLSMVDTLAKRYGFSEQLSSTGFRKGCLANPVVWIVIIPVFLHENFQCC